MAIPLPDFAAERDAMVERDLERRGIGDALVLDAFRAVPREAFVDPAQAHLAYGDHPLPIPAGQTISQPFVVAEMIQQAAVRPGGRVLEVGAGSGYAAALISRIAAEVVAIERQAELVVLARERLQRLGYDNVVLLEGDGTLGAPAYAPFDAIIAAASGRQVPRALIDQLKPGGRIVMPLGAPGGDQQLVRLTKTLDCRLEQQSLGGVRFVPLIGEQGWGEEDEPKRSRFFV